MARPNPDRALRDHLVKLLAWEDTHAGFEAAVARFPARLRGVRPQGLPYSAWQLLEHLRLAQRDILDFCRDPGYATPKWPDAYWPASPEPPSGKAWERSVAAVRADRAAMQELAADPKIDLLAKVPNGDGQTFLREVLLAADHGAYHVGELVALRRMLGAWK